MKKLVLFLFVAIAAITQAHAFTAQLIIKCDQSDAKIFCDGKYRGDGTAIIKLGVAKTVVITISKPGYKEYSALYYYKKKSNDSNIVYVQYHRRENVFNITLEKAK